MCLLRIHFLNSYALTPKHENEEGCYKTKGNVGVLAKAGHLMLVLPGTAILQDFYYMWKPGLEQNPIQP